MLGLGTVLHPLTTKEPPATGPTYMLGPPGLPTKTSEDPGVVELGDEADEGGDDSSEEAEPAVGADTDAVAVALTVALEEAFAMTAEASACEMVSVLVATEPVAVAVAALALLPSVLGATEPVALALLLLLLLELEPEAMPTASPNFCD